MTLSLVLLVIGLLLLIKGGDLFVSASVRIAEMLRVPRIVIGSTLVSLATTSPELVVSIVAGVQGASDLALGNAVGSCICNIALILGLSACLKHIQVHPESLRTPLVTMIIGALLLFGLTLNLELSKVQGVLLVGLGVTYFIYDFTAHKRITKPEAVKEATELEEAILEKKPWLHTGWGTTVQFLIAAVLVIVGSKLLVDSAVSLATALKVPPVLIGLTVVALGTSLPELITAISSSRQNVSDLAIGNVLGANIANLTLIVGSAAAITPFNISRSTQVVSFPVMLATMLILAWMLHSERQVSRREGGILVVIYAAYIALLALLNFGQK